MVKLYGHPLSTFVHRVRIALAEKGVDWPLEVIDMAQGAHRQEAYLAINPYGRVPAIDDDGFRLYESVAILGYLESLHPTPALVPDAPQDLAAMQMHTKLCDIEFTRHVGVIIFPKRFLPKEKWDLALFARAQKHIARHLSILDTHLADGRDHLAGERFTHADIVYAPFLPYLKTCEIDPPPHVERWGRKVMARPSVESTRAADAPRW